MTTKTVEIRLPRVGDVFTCSQIRSCRWNCGWEPVKIPAKLNGCIDKKKIVKLVIYKGDPKIVRHYNEPRKGFWQKDTPFSEKRWIPSDEEYDKLKTAYILHQFKRNGKGFLIEKKKIPGVSLWSVDATRETARWVVRSISLDAGNRDFGGKHGCVSWRNLTVIAERLDGRWKGERIVFILHLNSPACREKSCIIHPIFPNDLVYEN
jgi:hypothetical protein